MSSFADSFFQPGDDSPLAESTRSVDDGDSGYDPRLPSQRFDAFSTFLDSESVKDSVGDSPIFNNSSHSAAEDAFASQTVTETPSPPSIYGSGGGFSTDAPEFPTISQETNGNGPVLPPPSEMQADEGFALREWRRQNAVELQEKEKSEKEVLNQIIDEADEYKVEFYRKRKIACENNKTTNREKEKLILSSQEKFHAEADKNYWKAIAELIPNEVPRIEKRRGKKEHDGKPSVVVIQGPKPGKPTDLSRMRQILIKLKHNPPQHLKPSPPTAHAKDGKSSDSAATTTTVLPNASALSTVPQAVLAA